jgi:hypothetical protein
MSKEGKRSSSAIKKTLIVFGAAVAVFAILNILWFFGYRIQYNKIAARLDASEYTEDAEAKTRTVYSKTVEEYIVQMNFPSYLQKGGKVTMRKNPDLPPESAAQNDDKYSVSFYYWPKPFGKERLGVTISENDTVEENWYQIYIYPDLSLVIREDYTEEEIVFLNELIETNRAEIERMKAIFEDTIGVDFDSKAWYGKV